jgi:hypothetical protein
MKKTRGFLLFAMGSGNIQYGKLAVCCALSIKTNLKNNNVTVVVDDETNRYLKTSLPKDIVLKAFDKIIVATEKFKSTKRKHYDSPWRTYYIPFNNQNRVLTYDYSPYYETILIDVDFLIMENSLDDVWGNDQDILMNSEVRDLQNNKLPAIEDNRLSKHGIPLYWASLVYFKKSSFAKTFFGFVSYIREQYNFYQFLYGFKKGYYRNDFSFSIAAHVLSGYKPRGIKSFPQKVIRISPQKDSIAKIIDSKEIIFLSNHPDEQWKNTLINMKGFSVHIMNKQDLLRVSDEFIESCMEKL